MNSPGPSNLLGIITLQAPTPSVVDKTPPPEQVLVDNTPSQSEARSSSSSSNSDEIVKIPPPPSINLLEDTPPHAIHKAEVSADQDPSSEDIVKVPVTPV